MWLTSCGAHCCSVRARRRQSTRQHPQSCSGKKFGASQKPFTWFHHTIRHTFTKLLSPVGRLARDGANVLLLSPSVLFSHAPKWRTAVAKTPEEIRNRTLQPRHRRRPLKSDFYTFPDIDSLLPQQRTLGFSLGVILLCSREVGGKLAP